MAATAITVARTTKRSQEVTKKQVIIMRGPSGSGKSTKAKAILSQLPQGNSGVIVSADQFFMKNGVYTFDPTQLSQAHNYCFHRFLESVEDNINLIIVDNTNQSNWEYRNYVKVAKMLGYEVNFVSCQPKQLEEVKECIRRSTHGVPGHIILQQVLNYEPDPEDADRFWPTTADGI
jgi:predicted ABC-type ATPase